jgi:putative ABC transport system permease protein
MLTVALKALLSHWVRSPFQLTMMLIGLSAATALWSGVQAVNSEARASYDSAASQVAGERFSRLEAPDGQDFDEENFIRLRRAGWLVSPVLEGTTILQGEAVRVLGVDPLTLPSGAVSVDPAAPGRLGLFLSRPGLILASADIAAKLSGRIPQTIETSEDLPDGTVVADIGLAQMLLDRPGRISRLIVASEQRSGLTALQSLAPELELRAPAAANDLARLTDSFHLNLTAFGFLAFVVGLFIVYSAVGLAFEQRRPTFRTLRALGVSTATLSGLLVFELGVFALVGGALGVVLGYGVAGLLLPGVSATLEGLYGAVGPQSLTLRPSWWISGMALSALGVFAASAQGVWTIWRMPVLASAQPRAWARASRAVRLWQAGFACVFCAGALILLQVGNGLLAGFAVMGGLLLGAALALPLLLSATLEGLRRLARTPLTEWFFADTLLQAPRLSFALMALLMALSANVGVGVMVSSFRLTFNAWLDQRFVADVYVSARSSEEGDRLFAFAAPRVQEALPIWGAEARLGDLPGEIFGVAVSASYRDHWPLLEAVPDAWDRVETGGEILINEQLARRRDISPGDMFDLGPGWSARIAGVYSDYGNPEGQALVEISEFRRRFPDAPRLRYAFRTREGDTDAFMRSLVSEFGLPSEAIINQAQIKAVSRRIFEQTFAVTAALNALTLSVAGLALFASLMTLSSMRVSQLAPVWAMGARLPGLAGLELLRTAGLALLVTLAAIPTGLGLAHVLLSVVNVEAFGWRLPMHVFPGDWLQLGVLSMIVALVATLIPAQRLAYMSPSVLLKVFTSER